MSAPYWRTRRMAPPAHVAVERMTLLRETPERTYVRVGGTRYVFLNRRRPRRSIRPIFSRRGFITGFWTASPLAPLRKVADE